MFDKKLRVMRRAEPFNLLRQMTAELDRVFDEPWGLFAWPAPVNAKDVAWAPKVDLLTNDNTLIARVDLPRSLLSGRERAVQGEVPTDPSVRHHPVEDERPLRTDRTGVHRPDAQRGDRPRRHAPSMPGRCAPVGYGDPCCRS